MYMNTMLTRVIHKESVLVFESFSDADRYAKNVGKNGDVIRVLTHQTKFDDKNPDGMSKECDIYQDFYCIMEENGNKILKPIEVHNML